MYSKGNRESFPRFGSIFASGPHVKSLFEEDPEATFGSTSGRVTSSKKPVLRVKKTQTNEGQKKIKTG